MKKGKKLESKILFENPWWTYCTDKYILPNEDIGEYHYVHTDGSAFIIPVMDDGKILLVNQYRYLNDRFSIEFPGGGIKAGQNPDEISRKELIEETGFDGKFEKAGIFNPYNGITDEICHVYIARNLIRSDEFSKDDSEEFEICFFSVNEVDEKIKSNEIYDGMTMAAWALARHRL
jgi:ADP-ribose pyrophosphatase